MNKYSGYVYVLSNPAMPGIVKIGRSKHGGVNRAKQLYSSGKSGIPMQFKLEFEIYCDDCYALEHHVHEEISHLRINQDREFFKIDADDAIDVVIKVFGYWREFEYLPVDQCIDINDFATSNRSFTRALSDNDFYPPDVKQLLYFIVDKHPERFSDCIAEYKTHLKERKERLNQRKKEMDIEHG